MKSPAAVPIIARLREGIPEAVVALMRARELGSMVAVLMTLSLVLLAEGRPGDLDPTFGIGGKVTTDFFGNGASALVLQPDGKLVAAGQSCQIDLCDFALARCLPDGSLDPTFGVGGKTTTDFGTFDLARALILQPDGKLVAAGFSISAGGNFDFALARYLPDGSLDPTFGTGGQVATDFGDEDQAFALVLQPDGKLVAAGGSCPNVLCDFTLARYLPDGRLDPTFGVGGKITTNFGGFDQAHALVRQPDGKLVTAGRACQEGGLCDFALARYLPDGRLDPTFGVGGKVTTDFEILDDPSALILQPDGKLVAAAEIFDGSSSDFGLVRYLPNGSLDPTFGVGGKVRTDFEDFDLPAALILQPDGKLVAAGSSFLDFALARYLPDGRLDPAFGVEGLVMTSFDGDDIALALVLQPDGKLVAAGRAAGEFALARYELSRGLEVAMNIKQGRTERLGTTKTKVTMEGQLADASLAELDLSTSTVTITSVLNEAGIELVAGASLPLTLAARPGSDADGATFETPGGARPKVRMDMSHRGEEVVSVRLVVEFAPSQQPALCKGTPRTTELTTRFQLDPGQVTVATTQPWQCLAGDSQLRVPVP